MHEYVREAEKLAPLAVLVWMTLSLPVALLVGRMMKAREIR